MAAKSGSPQTTDPTARNTTERLFTETERQAKCWAVYLVLGLGHRRELLGNDTHPHVHLRKYTHGVHTQCY